MPHRLGDVVYIRISASTLIPCISVGLAKGGDPLFRCIFVTDRLGFAIQMTVFFNYSTYFKKIKVLPTLESGIWDLNYKENML